LEKSIWPCVFFYWQNCIFTLIGFHARNFKYWFSSEKNHALIWNFFRDEQKHFCEKTQKMKKTLSKWQFYKGNISPFWVFSTSKAVKLPKIISQSSFFCSRAFMVQSFTVFFYRNLAFTEKSDGRFAHKWENSIQIDGHTMKARFFSKSKIIGVHRSV